MAHQPQWQQRRTLGALGAAIALATLPVPSLGVQFPDGTVAFTTPPRLAAFEATRNLTGVRHVTYYFTVTLPAAADEGLKTLEIQLIEGRANRLGYDLEATTVFGGHPDDRGPDLAIASTAYDEDTQTVTLTLAEAAAPGQDLTVALHPVRNPVWEGVYLFELTAWPAGELTRSQRVGTARLHLYRPDGRDPLF
ncbi:MAG: DUF2808 domain-containing protein [Cyanobacteria bacterium]|nr:DUF2808 domain-containing protein [Cyanobacteriota bacterium]